MNNTIIIKNILHLYRCGQKSYLLRREQIFRHNGKEIIES